MEEVVRAARRADDANFGIELTTRRMPRYLPSLIGAASGWIPGANYSPIVRSNLRRLHRLRVGRFACSPNYSYFTRAWETGVWSA
jgi:hypothetical protein